MSRIEEVEGWAKQAQEAIDNIVKTCRLAEPVKNQICPECLKMCTVTSALNAQADQFDVAMNVIAGVEPVTAREWWVKESVLLANKSYAMPHVPCGPDELRCSGFIRIREVLE